MRVLLFAEARRVAGGRGEVLLDVTEPLAEEELWRRLIKAVPALEAIRPATRLARNGTFVGAGATLEPEDEVALIPPVSGG